MPFPDLVDCNIAPVLLFSLLSVLFSGFKTASSVPTTSSSLYQAVLKSYINRHNLCVLSQWYFFLSFKMSLYFLARPFKASEFAFNCRDLNDIYWCLFLCVCICVFFFFHILLLLSKTDYILDLKPYKTHLYIRHISL